MDELIELRRRKAALKAKLEQQQKDLKATFGEIRDEVEPTNLLKKAVSGAFGLSKTKDGETGKLTEPLAFLTDLLIKDPRLAFLIKTVAPMAMNFLPKKAAEKSKDFDKKEEGQTEKPIKTRILGQIRRGVSALRTQLKKPADIQKPLSGEPEN